MKLLIQKKFFHTREFEILEDKLRFKEFRLGNENEIFIPFENIIGDKTSFKKIEPWYIFIGLFFTFLAFVSGTWFFDEKQDIDPVVIFLWGSISIIFYFLAYKIQENSWRVSLVDSQSIVMFKNYPNEIEVEEFFRCLIDKRNVFLMKNYCIVDENIDYERQFNNLEWLRSRNVLSVEEFEKKYTELKKLFKIENKRIGFDNLN